MKYFVLILLIVILPFTATAQRGTLTSALVLEHVTIIDLSGGPSRNDMSVVVVGRKIESVGRTGKVRIPKGALKVDGKGKFLIPGLWDMHVHLSLAGESALSALVANGVTSVRDMGGDLKEIDAMREMITAGQLIGPRILRSGPVVDGPKDADYRLVVRTPDEARSAVRRLKALGVDFIKIHNAIPRAAYYALANEARKAGLSFTGHIPAGMSAAEVSDAGQRSIEHTESLLDLPVADAAKRTKDPNEIFALALGAYSGSKGDLLFRRFVKNGTWFDPTLVEYRSFAFRADLEVRPDGRTRYVATKLKEYWNKTFPVRGDEKAYAARKSLFQEFLRLVGRMQREGVQLIAGTDLGARDVYPGFSLHDELELLVAAGLTPLEALRAATINPARFFGKQSSFGKIANGHAADMVLIDADPLRDISNTKKISAVFVNGRYLDRGSLDKMLADVRAANEK